jgi:Glycosyl transferase family 2
VIATSGRATLTDTLAALTPQLEHGDEILIVRDSTGDHGNTPRNAAIPRCAGTHLMFIDDDDQHAADALQLVRSKVRSRPKRVHLFSMVYTDGRVVHPRWPLQIGYVGTPMIVVPNQPGQVGQWSNRYEGDYDFLVDTMQLRGDAPVLHAEPIAAVTPPAQQRDF